jgi:hypothetical protein
VFPAKKEESRERKVFVNEPEILTAITVDGQHIVLGIGFFHGKNGDRTKFEVYTPAGYKWGTLSTP